MLAIRRFASFAAAVVLLVAPAVAQVAPPVAQVAPPATPATQKVSPAQVKAAIDLLGSIDFPVRMEAARGIRRADSTLPIPALVDAVASHTDTYIRFKALVILSG